MQTIKQLQGQKASALALAAHADTDNVKLKDAKAEYMPELNLSADGPEGAAGRYWLRRPAVDKARTRAACIKAAESLAELPRPRRG